MDAIAGTLAMMITAAMLFIAVAPYLGLKPAADDTTLITQNQTVVQNMFIAIVSFFFGASVGTRKKDDTIAAQAAALPPSLGTPS